MTALHVWWKEPAESLPSNSEVLSFLLPSVEEKMKSRFGTGFMSARELALDAKQGVIESYIHFVASVGATPVASLQNQTLRQVLSVDPGGVEWWAHPFVIKNAEATVEYEWFVATQLIDQWAKRKAADTLVFYGAPTELSHTFKEAYCVREVDPYSHYSFSTLPKTVLYRVGYAARFFWNHVRLMRLMPKQLPTFDTAFIGFWDWSVKGSGGAFQDKYFKSLPQKMQERGHQVGWLLWLDHTYEPGSKGRSFSEVIRPLLSQKNTLFFNQFLSISQILVSFLDVRSFLIIYKLNKKKELYHAFKRQDINYLSLFKTMVFSGFLGAQQLESRLVFKASVNLMRHSRLKGVFHFLEFFSFSRSFYAASRAVGSLSIQFAVQHASYGYEKTFGRIDPVLEKRGEPDGVVCPVPDYLCAMGEQGRTVFENNGFSPTQVVLTGSSRYEALSVSALRPEPGGVTRILVPTSLSLEIEMELLDALYEATKEDPRFQITIRSHPYFLIQHAPQFKKWKDKFVISSTVSLQEELAKTDGVLYAYSTVGEEAQCNGIPAIHWVSWRFCGDSFPRPRLIPIAWSVESLRTCLDSLFKGAMPAENAAQDALHRYFYKADGHASDRIAELAHNAMKGVAA